MVMLTLVIVAGGKLIQNNGLRIDADFDMTRYQLFHMLELNEI